MKTIRIAAVGVVVCLFGSRAATANGEPGTNTPAAVRVLTLDECLRIGLRQSAAILQAREDVRIAETRIGQVRAQTLPHLSANAGYTRLDEVYAMYLGEERIAMGRLDNYSAAATVSQLLYSGGSIQAALRAARVYRDMARLRLEQASNELVRDIRTGFNDILLAEAALKVQEASVAQLQDLVRQAEARVKRGTAPEFDLLSARVRLANERPGLLRACKNVELAKAAFRNLLQLSDAGFELAGNLDYQPEKEPLETWLTAGLRARPELLYQQRVVELSKLDIRSERGGLQPQVRARAAYQGVNPESGTAKDAWDWGWNAGVSVDWDIFDGGLRRRAILEKKLALTKAQLDLDTLERAVELEIRQQYLELATAEETVAAGRETVALAEKNLEIARTRYETGLSTYLEYTDAQLALSTTRLTWLTAQRDHLNALARLRCACGRGLEPAEEEKP